MPSVVAQRGEPLTDRERQVLALVAQGFKDSRIAVVLGVSAATVATYRKRLRIKLGATCAAHSVALGFLNGYLKVRAEVPPR